MQKKDRTTIRKQRQEKEFIVFFYSEIWSPTDLKRFINPVFCDILYQGRIQELKLVIVVILSCQRFIINSLKN